MKANKKIFYLFALLSLALQAQDPGPPENLWAIGIGGATNNIMATRKDLYSGLKNFHHASQSFQIPNKERASYLYGLNVADFGGVRYFVWANKPYLNLYQQKIKELLLGKGPCHKAYEDLVDLYNSYDLPRNNEITKETVGKDAPKISDLTQSGRDDLSGYSEHDQIEAKFRDIAEKIKANDHLLIDITGHGLKGKGVILGGESVPLSVEKLGALIDGVHRKGAIVHLNVAACYSGSFTGLTSRAGTCVTTMTNGDLTAKSNLFHRSGYMLAFNENLEKYGSQLKGFACTQAQDPENVPQSSLDLVVERWEKTAKRRDKDESENSCDGANLLSTSNFKFQNFLQNFDRVVAEADEAAELRGGLKKALQEEYADTLEKCSSGQFGVTQSLILADLNMSEEEVKKHFESKFRACVSDYNLKDLKSILELRRVMKTSLGIQFPLNHRTKGRILNRYENFLSKADKGALTDFKEALCCLSYNFRTGKLPAVCGDEN